LTAAAREKRLLEPLDRWLTEAVHLGYSSEAVLRLVAERVQHFRWNSTTSSVTGEA
jgi:hypothetical protein